MAGILTATVAGNVGGDAEYRALQNGSEVANFSVAVTKRWTDRETQERREKTLWVRVACWGGLAGVARDYVKKGDAITVVGEPSASAWTNDSGEAQGTLEIRAIDLVLQGSRSGASNNSNGGTPQGQPRQQQPAPQQNLDNIPF